MFQYIARFFSVTSLQQILEFPWFYHLIDGFALIHWKFSRDEKFRAKLEFRR